MDPTEIDRVREQGAYFELTFSPNSFLIPMVRDFVGEFYTRVIGDAEAASRLAVATHELLENTVRYSIDGRSSLRIGVEVSDDRNLVTIHTRNQAKPEHQTALVSLLERLHTAQDREEIFLELLAQSARRTDGSGLGLARIHSESEMDLTCDIIGTDIHLRAQTTSIKRAGAGAGAGGGGGGGGGAPPQPS